MRLASNLTVRDERFAGKGGQGLVWRHPKNLMVLDEVQLEVLRAVRDGAVPTDYVARILAHHGYQVSGAQASRVADDLIREFEAHGLIEDGEQQAGSFSWVEPLKGADSPIVPFAYPMKVLCVTTFGCNLRCRHCGISCSPETAYPHELSTLEWLDLFREFHQKGAWEVVLTGGELMTRRDWQELLAATVNHRFATGIVTNGTVYTPASLDFLREYADAKREGFTVAVSLDGASPETHGWMRGSDALFDRTVRFVQALTEHGVDVTIGMTLHPHNRHEIRKMAELARSLGVRDVEFHPAELYGRALMGSFEMTRDDVLRQVEEVASLQEEFRQSIRLKYEAKRVPLSRDLLKAKGAHSDYPFFEAFEYPDHCPDEGIIKCAIDADGEVYPNEKTLGRAELRMGSIRERALAEVWQGPQWRFFRGGWSPEELHICRNCPLRQDCSTLRSRTIPWMTLKDPLGPMPECRQLPWFSQEVSDWIYERLAAAIVGTD